MDETKLREMLGGEPTELVRKKIADRLNLLTRQFVEAHGGTVELESVRGKGTTVTLRIPRGKR